MKISVLAPLIFFLASQSVAQELPGVVVKTFSVVVAFAAPPWSDGGEVDETSEIFQQEGASGLGHDMFIWEAIPKGESFEDWTELYALTAKYPLNGD